MHIYTLHLLADLNVPASSMQAEATVSICLCNIKRILHTQKYARMIRIGEVTV